MFAVSMAIIIVCLYCLPPLSFPCHIHFPSSSSLQRTLFPPSTPPGIVTVCMDSIVKLLEKSLLEGGEHSVMDLDRYLIWRPGSKATSNHSYTLHKYTREGMARNTRLPLPYPPKESCPGGEGACDSSQSEGGIPSGVPEVSHTLIGSS